MIFFQNNCKQANRQPRLTGYINSICTSVSTYVSPQKSIKMHDENSEKNVKASLCFFFKSAPVFICPTYAIENKSYENIR